MIKTRVREFRKLRKMTIEKLAELSGVSVSQVSRIETGERNWSVDSLPKIAKALGVDVLDLIDASKAWTDVPIFGSVGQDGAIRAFPNGQNASTARVPAAYGDVIALTISGMSQYPRYNEGDVLACAEASYDASQCLNRECVVTLDMGTAFLRIVQAGFEPGTYNLTSHNQPPMLNMKIVACRPVLYVGRA